MFVHGKYECFVMQMFYICVLYTSCGSLKCCIMHDFQLVNAGRGCKWRPYGRRILQSVSFCFTHAIAVSAFIVCRGLCAGTEMFGMCVCFM